MRETLQEKAEHINRAIVEKAKQKCEKKIPMSTYTDLESPKKSKFSTFQEIDSKLLAMTKLSPGDLDTLKSNLKVSP